MLGWDIPSVHISLEHLTDGEMKKLGSSLLLLGSCSLHTVYNEFKAGKSIMVNGRSVSFCCRSRILYQPFWTFFLRWSSEEFLNPFISFRPVNVKFADHTHTSFIFTFISNFCFHEQDWKNICKSLGNVSE